MRMEMIRLEHVTKSFGRYKALDDVSIVVEEGEFLTVIGRSGCGKTTMLRVINGLQKPDSGKVYAAGEDVGEADLIRLRRKIGYVIQNKGLFPHMTVEKNIIYVPVISGQKDKRQNRKLAEELIGLVGLEREMLDRYPEELSGGQQQRVGIARALASRPKLLLMDEPFGALDEITKRAMQNELLALQKKLGMTVVFITHDIREAMKLGDRVLVMEQGKIAQCDTPENVKKNPADEFVKELIGMCMGSGALFSICYGRRALRKLKEYIVSSFVLIFSVTVILTIVSYVCLDPILTLMQIPADIYGLMRSYMGLILAGLIFVFLYNYFAFLLRSSGNSVIPLIFLGVGTALNIGLDFFFVAKLGRGVKGAAEATVLAQAAAGLGIALYALVKEPELNMKKMKEEGIGIRADLLKEIFSYSASTGIQQSVMNFGILMVQGLVNSFGTSVMAAFAAGVKIDTLAYMPAQEFGNAYSIFISQNYGADKKERIRKGTKSAAVTVIMFCAAASAAVFFGAEFLMGIFIDPQKTQIIQIGTGYLKTEGACYCGIGILFLLYGYFRAVERPKVSLLLTILSLGTRVVLAYACAPLFGVGAIWTAIPIGWAMADAAGIILLRRGERTNRMNEIM